MNIFAGVILLAATASSFAASGDWPQWRGPARDGHAGPGAPLPKTFSNDPKIVWKLTIGGGFSSPVVSDDKLVYLDAQNDQEVAHCIRTQDGKELWATPYAPMYGDEWGSGPRSTPTIDGDRVYAQSCSGELRCFDLGKGEVKWGASFEKDFGVKFYGRQGPETATAARRGNNGSPLVDGNAIIVVVGSPEATVVSFDKLTGKVNWKCGKDTAAYSSPIAGTLAGKRQIVVFVAEGLLGIDPEQGAILWRVPLVTNARRHACTPILFGDNVIVNSHTFGMISFKISKTAEGFKATEAWSNKALKINVATPVLVDHWLFSQGPTKNFICADATTGELMWSQAAFGKEVTSSVVLGRNIAAFVDDGQLVFLEANPAKYVELARAQIAGKNWNHPAYARGKLYVRDYHELIAVDLLAQ